MDPELKREIILDNYQNPYNKETVNDNAYIKVNSNNESCIDDINLYILIKNDIIKDIKFDGEACAISTASTSIMIKSLIGKTKVEALNILNNFENMINEKSYPKESMDEMLAFDEIYKQQNRKHCALLPWIGLKEALNK